MSGYAMYFDYSNATYRLPTNPETLTITSTQANEKYVVLGLGQIAVPTNMELSEYSFTVEFPHSKRPYIETSGGFKGPDYYFNLFDTWRQHKDIVRFIAHNGITKDINTLVLIEEFNPKENAGEEGDWYVDFKLLEYKEFGKKSVVVKTPTVVYGTASKPIAKAKKSVKTTKNPKTSGKYTVKKGDSLWAIAKKMYGDGAKYTVIANANKSQIKHQNLIYPGQVLTIP